MNIFGVGLPEVTLILVLALIIFGPKKLPELGKQLGKTLKSLKKASNEFQNEIDQAINKEEKEDLLQQFSKDTFENQTNTENQDLETKDLSKSENNDKNQND